MEGIKKYNPIFSHHNDLIAFVVHMSFLQHCKLVGLSQEQYLDDIGSVPQGWNRSSDLYTFRYVQKDTDANVKKTNDKNENENENENKNEDNNNNNNLSTILLTIIQLEENNLIISAVRDGNGDGNGNDNVFTLDLIVSDHIKLDKKISSDNDNDNTNIHSIFKDFTSLQSLIQLKITNPLFSSSNQISNDKEKEKDKTEKDKTEKDKEKEKDKDKDKEENVRRDGDELMFDDFGTYPNLNDDNDYHPVGGDFGRDIDVNPLRIGGIGGVGGVGGVGMGGNLMGPNHPRFGAANRGIGGGISDPNNQRPDGVPNGARFDRYGPGPLGNRPGPDPDHMIPPTQGNRRGGRSGGRGGGGGSDPFGMFL